MVSAINASQVEIVFNQKMDKDTAEDLANYYVGLTKDVSANSIETLNTGFYTAKLQKDEKTVIISSEDLTANVIWEDENTDVSADALVTSDGEVLKNRTVYVQIKDVKTADAKLTDALETSFVAKDSEGPAFAENSYAVEKVDAAAATVTFNEPVVFSTLSTPAQFYLNGTNVTAHVDYKATSPETVAEFSTVEIDLLAAGIELDEGNNTFEVVGLQDLAGNATSPSRITTTINVEESVAVTPKFVDVEQVHDAAFRVIFDRPVDEAGTITIKNLENDNVDYLVDIKNAGDTAANETKIDTTYTAPAGTTYTAYLVEFDQDFVVDEAYDGANNIIRTVVVEDYKVGTKTGTKLSKAYTFKKDNIAPTLVKATTAANHEDIVFTFADAPFDGDVVFGTPANDIVLKLVEDGITHTVAVTATSGGAGNFEPVVSSKNQFILDLDPTDVDEKVLFANGKLKSGVTVQLPYGIVTDDAADATPQYSGPFAFIGSTVTVIGGTSAIVPQTSQADVSYNATLNAIELQFHGEDINAATVTNKANYTFDGKALPAGASIEYDSSKIARIYLPANSVVRNGNYSLSIENVATNSGAKMLPTNVTVYNVTDNTQPAITGAKVTADNTVEVTFDETLDFAAPTDLTQAVRNFKIVINGAKYNVASVVKKGSSTRTLVLTTADTFAYNNGVKVEFAPDASNDVFIYDEAGNKAATKTVTATIDVQ